MSLQSLFLSHLKKIGYEKFINGKGRHKKKKKKKIVEFSTVRDHPNLEDFPKFGEIANFKIGEFPQIWRNSYFSFLFVGGKEGSKYAVIIHGHTPV